MSAIPAGYKQTEVGVIPVDWVVGRVGGLVEKVKSGLSRRLQAQDLGIPVLTSGNIQNNRLVIDDLKYWYAIDPQGANTENYILDDGDILLCFINSLSQIGKPCIYRDIGRPVIYTTNIFRVVVAKRCSPEFVFYLFSSTAFQEVLQLIVKPAINQASFTKADFLRICVPFPPKESEQRAIAAALSDVDALLAKLDQFIAKKRDLKQAAMQQLLTGQTRLPGFSGEWEVKRMKSLGNTYGGLTGKTQIDFGHGRGRYIPFMNVMTDTVIDVEWLEVVDVSSNEVQNLTQKGDLFFNGSSETPEEVGFCSVLLQEVPNLYLNSFCFGFRFNSDAKVNGLFFAYWFRSVKGRETMAVLAQGATRYNIAKSAFLRLELPQPPEEEQTAIATVLSDMDAELATLEARRDKTRALKQGMMQELLTGRIRLV